MQPISIGHTDIQYNKIVCHVKIGEITFFYTLERERFPNSLLGPPSARVQRAQNTIEPLIELINDAIKTLIEEELK